MFRDAQLVFSEAQAITAAAVSQNVIDTSIIRDLGTGERLYIVVVVLVAFTAGGITLTVTLQGDSVATMGTLKTRDLFIIPASTAAGAIFFSALDPAGLSPTVLNTVGFPESQRFYRLNFTPNGGSLTTGTVTAFIARDIQEVNMFATGITAAA